MQNKDLRRFNLGLNKDDNPTEFQPGEYSDALNMRVASSTNQQGFGILESLQGEIEILLNAEATYYGGAIGGQFVYQGYEEVTIGNQVWMKRNLDIPYPGSRDYNDNPANRDIYGALYNWNHLYEEDLIPDGWRVPTEADIDELLAFVGGSLIAGGVLKEYGETHWQNPNTGSSDLYGFQALPAGMFDTIFNLLGVKGSIWMLGESEPAIPPIVEPVVIGSTFFMATWDEVLGADGYYLTVSTDPNFTPGSEVPGFDHLDVGNTDHYLVDGLTDGITYYYHVTSYNDAGESDPSETVDVFTENDSVVIGSQLWMTKNVTINLPGSYVYDDNEANRILYGGLYSWDLIDEIEAAYPGWRVPTSADWAELFATAGGTAVAGGELKAVGGGWDPPNTGAVDTYDFFATPTGDRIAGVYSGMGLWGFYWTKTETGVGTAVFTMFRYDNDDAIISVTNKTTSLAVRLVSDFLPLSAPVADAATNINDSSFSANWQTVSGATGYRLTVATDAGFTNIVPGYNDLDVGNVLTASVVGLDEGHTYYYRVEAYNPTFTSANSNTITVGLTISWIVTSRGDGSGGATMTLRVSDPVTLTLDGTARFYSDAACTLNESTTKVVNPTPSLTSVYIKCPSGASNLTFSNAYSLIWAGNANGLGSTNPFWGRAVGGSYDANTPNINISNWYFPNCINLGLAYGAPILTAFTDIGELSPSLEKAVLNGATFTGTLSDIGSLCYLFSVGANTISGNINTLTSSMQRIGIAGNNTISGNIADIQSGMIDFQITGSNTLTGDIADLPVTITNLIIGGNNTTSGDIADIGVNMLTMEIYGNNTITGDIVNLKEGLTRFVIFGNNTIYGDIADTPNSLSYFYIAGDNVITGDVADITLGIRTIIIFGLNTIYGLIQDVPLTVTTQISIAGNNTIAGDIGLWATPCLNVIISGNNTITGDIGLLSGLIRILSIQGNNTLYGDIEDLPTANLTYFQIGGNNTISGVLNATVYAMTKLTTITIYGQNTISGNLSNLPINIASCYISGQNTISDYTAGRVFVTALYTIEIYPVSGGLSSTEVDNLLIDLSTKGWLTGGKTVRLLGTNAPRTAASDVAVAILTGLGVTVQTN